MKRMCNDYSRDKGFTNFRRGLYVEPPRRPIDLDTIPDDGNEYIHKTRIESSLLNFKISSVESESSSSSETREIVRMNKIRLRKTAAEFASFANNLHVQREYLRKKFPQSEIIPVNDENASCLFCLGSEIYLKIYTTESRSAEAHLPLLSYVIHLTQREVHKLLRYTSKWFKIIGMNEILARWVFSMLACTEKPLSDEQEQFLAYYFDGLKLHLQNCEDEEYQRVRMLMSLIEKYFVINFNQHNAAYLTQINKLRRS